MVSILVLVDAPLESIMTTVLVCGNLVSILVLVDAPLELVSGQQTAHPDEVQSLF